MGCGSSKRIDTTVDVYKPAPASFAVFDINAIEEPWLKLNTPAAENQLQKPTNVPAPILRMVDAAEAPQSWAQVSQALQDLKSTLDTLPQPQQTTAKQTPTAKSLSFHTIEELDGKRTSKPEELRKTESTESADQLKKAEAPLVAGGMIKNNIFIVRDRLEREKEGKEGKYDSVAKLKRDPLSEYEENCPPGGGERVVIYTTSLGGVRRTFEDCNRVRDILEGHTVIFDERDVSLHGEYLKELKELVEEQVPLPRVFVKGRYVGGVDELVELNESGRLGRIFNATRVERGIGRQACGGCGGARFVPCLDCGGSRKLADKKERCPTCNENGLVHCSACASI